MKILRGSILGGVFVLLAAGCSSKPPLAQLSGTVTFKGQPVPAGYISFTPQAGGESVCVVQIKDGKFDTAQMVGEKGLHPGPNTVRIAGFDGKRVPQWGQGKQIFNPVEEQFSVSTGTTSKEFVVPESAGKNVRIEPTSDD